MDTLNKNKHTIRKFGGFLLLFPLFFLGGYPFDVFSADQEQMTGEKEALCFQVLKEGDLFNKLDNQPTIELDMGEEVSLRVIAGRVSRKLAVPPSGWMRISVFEKGNRVKDLPESFYRGYRLLNFGPFLYWMIGEYTGGANCCFRYHFFGRAANRFLQYLGATPGSIGSLDDESFLCRNGQIYLRGQDIRFLHFHTPHAMSRLVFAIYYRLTPDNIIVDNKPFRQEYLQELQNVEDEIKDLLKKSRSMPASILRERKESGSFSDDLGQLLVKKAMLRLFAGEENKAWSILEEDIRLSYQTTRGFGQIKDEIKRIMKKGPN